MNNPLMNNSVSTQSSTNIEKTTQVSFYAFLLLTFILIGRPQDVFQSLQPLRPGFIVVLINLILVLTQNKNPLTVFMSHSIGKKYLYFYGMMVIGIPFAYYRRGAFDFVILQYIINILYFFLFLTHIHSYERIRFLVFTIICSICFYGLNSMVSGGFQGGRYSFGVMYDPNDLAYLFVSLVPFTALFISESGKITTKLFAGFTMVISLILILFTGSRGGLIGLVTLLSLFLFTKLSPVNKSIRIVLLIGVLILAVTNKDVLFTDRNASILHLGQDYNVTDEEGRIRLWQKGLEFTFKNPLTGVGAMCFREAMALDRKQRHLIEKWQPVHNSYLQISSELGLIAAILFILMIKETILTFKKIRLGNDEQITITDIQRLAGIAQIGFISHLIVAFFLTQGYSILFTLFFAFASAMDNKLDPV
jgi:O-antigen ligase